MKKLMIISIFLLINNAAFAKDEPYTSMLNQKNNNMMISNGINKDSNSIIGAHIETPIKKNDISQESRASQLSQKTSIELYGLVDVGVAYSK